MTTPQKLLLSLATITALTSAAFAGTITAPTTLDKLGEEKLSIADATVTDSLVARSLAVGDFISYKPSDIPAGVLANPIFKYTFSNVKDIDLATTLAGEEISVYEVVDPTDSLTWIEIADRPTVSGDDNNILIFRAVNDTKFAANNKEYVIARVKAAIPNAGKARSINTPLKFTVPQGATGGINLKVELYSGDSQGKEDETADTQIKKIVKEFSGAITTKFDAKIDAAASFLAFKSAPLLEDAVSFSTTREADLLVGSSLNVVNDFVDVVVEYDENLTKNSNAAQTTINIDAIATNDFNATGTTTAVVLGATVDSTVTLDLTGNSAAIPETQFTLSTSVTDNGNTFPIIVASEGNAGEWTIDGYAAQIPNAAGLSTHDTVLKFTNRSSIDTDIFFTIIDPDGKIETLSSADNPEIDAIPSDATGKYVVSELLALIPDGSDFDKTGSVSIEVNIPTTPDKVYGMASFKNVTLGQFKDLPVYSNRTNSY